ncbi:MAG: cytidine deaminase [Chloroflexi bacterium HGW-Chloroflexi-2]|jgi:cytidine deaminase|nr:MAG: cytidine deaminase [Chloroflexi bacterium HGW-Chloroflexi-2]
MQINEEQKETLIQAAMAVRHWAYVPYSHYPVGAAILTTSGKIYDGINVESVAFPTTMCAERVAIFKAVSEGERDFVAIAVVTDNAGSPCGGCRQVMAEFGLETIVLIADGEGKISQETTVSGLLPGAFTPKDLPSL